MGSVSIWHLVVLVLLLVSVFPIIASPIIWYSTKDPNNKWLKILYWVRFTMGLLTLISIIKVIFDAAIYQGTDEYNAYEIIGSLTAKIIVAWLLMRRWIKQKEVGLPPEK